MNGFDHIFSAEMGQGTGACTLVHVQRACIVLSSSARYHEHRSFSRTPASMDLGVD